MKLTALVAVLAATNLFGASAMPKQGAYQMNRKDKVTEKWQTGTKLFDAQQFGTKGTWDFAKQGGAAGATIKLQDAEGLPIKLPTGAVVKDCMLDVVTAVTAGNVTSAKIGFSISDIGDIKATNLVHQVTGAVQPGLGYNFKQQMLCKPASTVATMFKLQSEGTLTMIIGSEALTAGKINVWLEYVLSE